MAKGFESVLLKIINIIKSEGSNIESHNLL